MMNLVGRRWSPICLLTLAITGCGFVPHETSTLSNTNPETEPLLVIMGGNTSCGTDGEGRPNSPYAMSLYRPAYELMSNMRDRMGLSPRFVVSCYDDTPTVSYSMSSDAEVVYHSDRHELDTIIEREMNHEAPLFFAGHSYGGWLAMKSSLIMGEKRAFTGVVTIDPISRVECTFDRPFGCQRAPQDISETERELINERSDQWINLYQTRTWYLHASAYEEADLNEKIDATHTRIDTHSRTWGHIRSLVEAYY